MSNNLMILITYISKLAGGGAGDGEGRGQIFVSLQGLVKAGNYWSKLI